MAKIALIGPSYESQSLNADCQSCVNLYPEQIESGVGNAELVLYPTPGLKTSVELSGLSVRGIFTIGLRTFAVSGTDFVEILSNNTSTVRGSVLNDSLPVSFASSAQQLLIASAGTAYVYDLGANTLTPIAGATFSGQVAQVGYSDGFFIVLIANSNTFYVSGPLDANDWVTNGASLVSVFPDNLISMLVDHREIWFWSATKAVVYYDSGNIFPFDVVPGGFIEQGIAAEFSPAKLDNTIFWLGSDDRGAGVVWRAQGYTPARVSNHAIEFAMQGYSRISDAIAFSFQMQGHYFYQLYFPTANKTWRYDTATNMWHEAGFWDVVTASFTAHRSQVHTFNFGKHLVGDWKSGKVYQMDIPRFSGGVWLFADDDGNPIRRVRRAPHLSREQKFTTHHQLQVYLESGLGPIPPLPGNEPPSNIPLGDALGGIWFLGVSNIGVLTTNPGFGNAGTIILNDPGNTTSWLVRVSTLGVLSTITTPFSPFYPQNFALVSADGTQRYGMQVTTLGVLQTNFMEAITRAPQISLSWSDDGGHSFSNEYAIGAGKAGEFSNRCMWRRLGRARDRVYQISMSDPVPWRIVAGYLEVGA